MASRDVLSLSLDDIIKMNKTGGGRGRGGRGQGRGRGRGQGRGAAGTSDSDFPTSSRGRGGPPQGRGRGRGWVRGRGSRGRGVRSPLTSRYNRGGRGANIRGGGGGRGANIREGGGGGGRGTNIRGGRGIVSTRPRGVVSTRARGRGVVSSRAKGLGVVITRTRGRSMISTRARGRGVTRTRGRTTMVQGKPESSFHDDSQDWRQQTYTRAASVRQQVARRKLEQARHTLALTQQINSKQARQSMINARRGITTPVTSRSNLGTPQHVRVGGSGAIVRGLRSDQLLLHQMEQSRYPSDASNTHPAPLSHQRDGGEIYGGKGPVVSLTSQHGLTVSIKNNISSFSYQGLPGPRSKPRLSRNRGMQHPGPSFSGTTFTVVNDRVQPVEPQILTSPEPPEPLRRPFKRNFIMSNDPRARTAPAAIPHHPDNVRPIPEAHRQILDPKVQKEIAMLQGKGEVILNNGPGPGVKGLRHIPSHCSRSLNERFTEERMVTE